MADSIGTLFFKDKQLRLILALTNSAKEWHLSDLSKETNVTYIHTSRFISKCEKYGLVATERHGRIKKLVLTEKGKEIAKGLNSVMEKVKMPEQQQQTAEKAAAAQAQQKPAQAQPKAAPAAQKTT
ncbi:MAG: MarR family transcriptional regulator [Candidatus Micrarchaeota archaeon]|nr:MarR family transcriptional regulator [Candidatus Micrarchaeota archaeon]